MTPLRKELKKEIRLKKELTRQKQNIGNMSTSAILLYIGRREIDSIICGVLLLGFGFMLGTKL